jgi:chemotaxis protein methyltransferase CheR
MVEGRTRIDAWSAGCGAGEEPYTLAIAWRVTAAPRWPALGCSILGTDLDEHQLGRARTGCYPVASLRELPPAWRVEVIEDGAQACVSAAARELVRLERHDVRGALPPGPFDVVLCRNLAFNYFDEETQRGIAVAMRAVTRRGGVLIVGIHEQLPAGAAGWAPCGRARYQAI